MRTKFNDLAKYSHGKHKRLLVAQCGKCFYCNDLMLDPTTDHFIPLSAGGSKKKVHNLVLACYECNLNKGHGLATIQEQRKQERILASVKYMNRIEQRDKALKIIIKINKARNDYLNGVAA